MPTGGRIINGGALGFGPRLSPERRHMPGMHRRCGAGGGMNTGRERNKHRMPDATASAAGMKPLVGSCRTPAAGG
jgi:hypothetical protein